MGGRLQPASRATAHVFVAGRGRVPPVFGGAAQPGEAREHCRRRDHAPRWRGRAAARVGGQAVMRCDARGLRDVALGPGGSRIVSGGLGGLGVLAGNVKQAVATARERRKLRGLAPSRGERSRGALFMASAAGGCDSGGCAAAIPHPSSTPRRARAARRASTRASSHRTARERAVVGLTPPGAAHRFRCARGARLTPSVTDSSTARAERVVVRARWEMPQAAQHRRCDRLRPVARLAAPACRAALASPPDRARADRGQRARRGGQRGLSFVPSTATRPRR